MELQVGVFGSHFLVEIEYANPDTKWANWQGQPLERMSQCFFWFLIGPLLLILSSHLLKMNG